MEKRSFQEEQNMLLQSYLNRYEKSEMTVEFIISSLCNQQCEYCYLYKHGKEMYPLESNKKENILRNFPLLLKYLKEEGYKYETYDIFSGEFFQLSYWEDIIKMICEDNKGSSKTKVISIPTNMSFLMDDAETKKVEYWIEKCKEYNLDMYLSASVDGPEDLEKIERPLTNAEIKDAEFYDKFFKFLAKHNFVPHPMITKNFVKNYKQNYDFWIDNLIKYNCKYTRYDGKELYTIPMLLEVRDPDQWDEESIENYKKFLWYMAEKDLEVLHKNNLEDFAMHMADDFSDGMMELGTYNHCQPYTIALPSLQGQLPCSIQKGPVFRVGDLSLVPCHRTCYPHMVYGSLQLNEEKNKIIGIKGDRPGLALKVKTLNPNRSYMKCSGCPIKIFCLKGCLGSQYENNKELFSAQDKVCDMFYAKYNTINEIAEHYGVYDIIKNKLEVPTERREFIEYARKILNNNSQ